MDTHKATTGAGGAGTRTQSHPAPPYPAGRNPTNLTSPETRWAIPAILRGELNGLEAELQTIDKRYEQLKREEKRALQEEILIKRQLAGGAATTATTAAAVRATPVTARPKQQMSEATRKKLSISATERHAAKRRAAARAAKAAPAKPKTMTAGAAG